MQVRIIDPANIDQARVDEAAHIIRAGGVVVFPTETVYGLGADATNADAVARIFAVKGRPSYNPLIVHAHDVASARRCVSEWPATARDLATRFWPGPLTLVLPKQPAIPDVVSAGLPTVGVRVPAHPVALALFRAADRPIAAPSANRSTQVSPTEGRHVRASLGSLPDLMLDAGPALVGIESTVLDLSGPMPTILRPGMISRAELMDVVGEVRLASTTPAAGEARPSPGMLEKHYSPQARLLVAADESPETLDALLLSEATQGRRAVVVSRLNYHSRIAPVRQMPKGAGDYAQLLYSTLHKADDEGFDTIIVEPVPTDDAWDGVRDRLKRAAVRET